MTMFSFVLWQGFLKSALQLCGLVTEKFFNCHRKAEEIAVKNDSYLSKSAMAFIPNKMSCFPSEMTQFLSRYHHAFVSFILGFSVIKFKWKIGGN